MRKLTTSLLAAAAFALGTGGALADSMTPQTGVDANSEVYYVRYDTDGDGDLSDEQVVKRTRAEIDAEGIVIVERGLEPFDYDNDGAVDWFAMNPQDFGSLDLNNDGTPDGQQ
jgi:hypothetical protein